MAWTVPAVVQDGAMRDEGQPTLSVAPGIVARPLTPTDAPWIIEAFEDPAIGFWHFRRLTVQDALDWIHESARRWGDEEGGNWAIVDDDDKPLGRLGLHSVSLRFGVAEVGYWVLPHARRRGIATAGVSALSSWALDDIGLHRLILEHSTQNEPSCRVAEAAGFSLEGVMRSALKHEDGWHDMHLHGRIASDG